MREQSRTQMTDWRFVLTWALYGAVIGAVGATWGVDAAQSAAIWVLTIVAMRLDRRSGQSDPTTRK